MKVELHCNGVNERAATSLDRTSFVLFRVMSVDHSFREH